MRHREREGLEAMRKGGSRFINVSPLRDDLDVGGDAEWLPIRPNTDAALMLGLAQTLLVQNRYDAAFLEGTASGFDTVRDYLLGAQDDVAKDVAWASGITGAEGANPVADKR